jgi:predicted amidohydrolase
MQPLTVSLLQTHTHWHDAEANRALFDGLFAQVPSAAQLVVLPEMFSTGFTMDSSRVAESMEGTTIAWMRERAQALGKVLCGSMVICAADQYFNRFIWVMPDGELRWYDKRHLFRMANEHEHYAAGSERITLELDGWRICPAVCYDLRFPVWLRNRGDYDVLLVVANWPAARQVAWQSLLRARAIENQAYCIGVNIVGSDGNGLRYAGGSAVYAHDGEELSECGNTSSVVTQVLPWQSLQLAREQFPVNLDADNFTLSK